DRPGDTTGLDWVRAVAATPAAPRFVLTTAMAEHAIAAFEAGAVDYLLKPFTRQRVAACVQRIVERRAPPHAAPPTALPTAASPTAALPTAALPSAALPTRLVARNAASLVLLSLDGILAFEASERLTYVHHLEGRFLVDPSLSALEAQFGELVLRTHRNWLAARRHVRRLDRASNELCLVVGDSLEVPVSRDRAAAVRKELLAGTLGLLR
ncbi:MAG TPA: LytTR family DNA-binding domain-containing protein, partial [Kofleriaceae bacterium]